MANRTARQAVVTDNVITGTQDEAARSTRDMVFECAPLEPFVERWLKPNVKLTRCGIKSLTMKPNYDFAPVERNGKHNYFSESILPRSTG